MTTLTAPSRSILITGCSSGIGLDAARTLRGRGWRVLASCRKPADCERLRQEGFESFPLDYADPLSVERGAAEALERTEGRLDALFNNGAHACPGAVEDLPRGALEAIFQANLFGWHDLTRRVIPAMRARGAGRIVNCSSVLGLVGARWRGAYVATKFALEGLTDVLRLEMAGTGIEVILIEPGPIATRIRENAVPHFERWIDWRASARAAEYESLLHRLYDPPARKDRWELSPAAVSAVLVRALESPRPRPRYTVTVPARAASVLRRILPTRVMDRITRRA
ncbi:Short-chain dehydrogenase [Rubellimicrobium thermophilum DSM 16684]|uniref:Short-chain dehydrogenase n=1 Tax=Rubellimicrobium thermophilum DSM 16684 TaxID=1123069 RepID=S9QT71_9RHOB|nr:SDR family NAD(P)-dependent oxidoreductase [Rubellimicrobium thermophilum]EPX82858.1 Short-chain dehydrogenase [Rubellimicrobium thermophilum DSM 16684]